MIQVEDLHKSFGETEVLKGVSVNVRRGTTRVILGLSGSGKTVLMKHIIGLLKPTSGKVVVDGEDITQFSGLKMQLLRQKFGMVFQQAALFDSMSVGDNVAFPLKEHTNKNPEEIRALVLEKLAVVDLAPDVIDKNPSELSGGMRKRVGLARAIVLNPECVLYDEPTTGLDPITTDSVDQMIKDAKSRLNVTSVVISHDVGSALNIADEIAVIHKGHIVEDCPADAIRDSKHPFVQSFLSTWLGKM